MSEYKATVEWSNARGEFLKGTYSREHTWTFDGGAVVPASPSPNSVPSPYSNAANVDPEEAFVAAISSCHMLVYLYLAYRAGFEVLRYKDEAVGVMGENEHGAKWVSSVVLRPQIIFGEGRRPSSEEEQGLHHAAHKECYIANSVKTEITVLPAP